MKIDVTFAVLLLACSLVAAGAVLMVLVPVDGPAPEYPEMVVIKDQFRDELVVNSTSPGLHWDDFQIQMSDNGRFTADWGANKT